MTIEQWWPRLSASARAWLIENNGDAISPEVLREIVAAGGTVTSDAWWEGQYGPSGLYLSDATVDWIEAEANHEHPGTN